MDIETAEKLPAELELALAYTPRQFREKLRAYLALDQRLSRIVSATTEPMLGQMRLAWWRDMLRTDASGRPRGDVVLEALGEHWHGLEASLIELVDGWEVLMVAEEIGASEIAEFAAGRAAGFQSLVPSSGDTEAYPTAAAARRWAIADAASRVSDDDERSRFVEAGLAKVERGSRFPQELRGLAVLHALSGRALKRGGRPLMEGRTAALTAIRAAILGR